MKIIKTAFAAVFAVIAITTTCPALELHAAAQAGLQELKVDLPPVTPPALAELMGRQEGLDPVVITVAGLSFGEIGVGFLELKYFVRLFKLLFPGKAISEETLVNELMAFNKEYFFLETDEDVRELAEASAKRRLPDDYIESKLAEFQGYQNHTVEIVPFTWSRDPGDTNKVVPELMKKITLIYDTYKGTGRPIYILAHSWGSVLSHEALHRLERSRPDVKVDKLLTAGSPLVPANFIMGLFVKWEITQEHLLKTVTKPANVGTWRNIWAERDPYSNAIPAADYNYKADAEVNVEPTLIDLILHNKLLRKEARRDLFKIRDLQAWHYAYFIDYEAYLKSINQEIFVPIFKPVLAPQVMDFAKYPVPAR